MDIRFGRSGHLISNGIGPEMIGDNAVDINLQEKANQAIVFLLFVLG